MNPDISERAFEEAIERTLIAERARLLRGR